MKLWKTALLTLLPLAAMAADLTGNWAAVTSGPDGVVRKSYFDLKQEGGKISGHIRSGQFYYAVGESTGGPEGFTLSAQMTDGPQQRTVKYEGKLVGDELHITTRRFNGAVMEMVAHRVAPGEGAMPKRIELPALHKVAYNGLAKTPPMGWNSWNKFAARVDDAAVRGMADAMVSSGMRDAGYIYVNIDDTWQGERDAQGNLQPNKKFPNMKALADYVHSKGMKIGIYSSPGPNTCAGYEGSYGHEAQDAKMWAAWGIDYLKYDWCGARNIYKDNEMQAAYQKMGDALAQAGRPILYSLCQYGRADVWKWGPDVGGNAWRTTGDIRDTWDSMSSIGFKQDELAPYAGPGHWNDPDMLEIGNGHMTTDEYRTHMSLWSMLASPLLAGNDLRDMTPEIKDILMNKEVIAIDQDAAGKQGRRVSKNGDVETWSRPLADGGIAVALFNRGANAANVPVKLSDFGVKAKSPQVRDLWSHKDVHAEGGEYAASVPSHGVVMLRIK